MKYGVGCHLPGGANLLANLSERAAVRCRPHRVADRVDVKQGSQVVSGDAVASRAWTIIAKTDPNRLQAQPPELLQILVWITAELDQESRIDYGVD
jgi:hypothetical protein